MDCSSLRVLADKTETDHAEHEAAHRRLRDPRGCTEGETSKQEDRRTSRRVPGAILLISFVPTRASGTSLWPGRSSFRGGVGVPLPHREYFHKFSVPAQAERLCGREAGG